MNKKKLNQDVLFLDIETVSEKQSFDHLDPEMQSLWAAKVRTKFRYETENKTMDIPSYYQDKAGIFAEFGKIVCISCGYFSYQGNKRSFRITAFNHKDENELLNAFAIMLNNSSFKYICGHNIKEFDIPYICRRMLIHGIQLPSIIDGRNKKPWELKHFLDTLDQWKFGDHKHYTSLRLLCKLFNIPSSKAHLDGSMIGESYWRHDDLKSISKYCADDVVACSRLYLCQKGIKYFDDTEIVYVNKSLCKKYFNSKSITL